jgi:MoxR-like ATPase
MKLEELQAEGAALVDEVGRTIVGKREVVERMLLCLLCDGHILLEDYPGLGKTLMANCLARASGCDLKRVQFTPDLMPSDILGAYTLDKETYAMRFRAGPVFCNILLADEINRAPPKTQSALLEAMQERQVSLEGQAHPLPRPFMVMATQNPIEFEGTYPLPEAQIDRFLMRTSVGYPDAKEEAEIVRRRKERKAEAVEVEKRSSPQRLLEMQAAVEGVHLDDAMYDYIVSIVAATRKHPQLEVGASPRGSLALMKLASAQAALRGRDFVLPDDVKTVALPALSHRLILRADSWVRGIRAESVTKSVLDAVPVPKVG